MHNLMLQVMLRIYFQHRENVNLVETPESKSAPEQAKKPAEKVELAAPEVEPKRVKKAPKETLNNK